MRIETDTRQLYDDSDPLCKCILSQANGGLYAFIQAIDTGMDGKDRHAVRYWGPFSHDNPEGSVRKILAYGGKWPDLPPMPK